MRTKVAFVVGFGLGYVLGARAGRERYEQLKQWWSRLGGSPAIQRAAGRTREVASAGARRTLTLVQQGVERTSTAVRARLHRGAA
jgi:hypothetical protein